MALDKQMLTLSLGVGLDTKTDPKQVIASKLLSLQNAVFGRGGEFQKRYGYNSLNSISAGNAIASFQDQLIGLDGTNLKSYSAKQAQFNTMGTKISVDLDKKVIARRSGNYERPDGAYNAGVYGYIFNDFAGTKTYISVIDSVTGQDIIKEQLLGKIAYNGCVRAHALGTKIIFTYSTVGAELGYYYIDVSAPQTLVGPVVLKSDYAGVFDCTVVGTNLVYSYADNTGQTSSFTLSSALAIGASFKVAVTPISLGIFADTSNQIWVGNTTNTGGGANYQFNYFILNAAVTAVVLVNTTMQSIADTSQPLSITGIYTGGNGNFFWTILPPSGNTDQNYVRKSIYSVAGAAVSAASTMLRGASLESKPFVYNSVVYVVVYFQGTIQKTYFLVNSSGVVAAKFAPDVAYETFFYFLRSVITIDANTFQMAYTEIDAVASIGGILLNQRGVSRISFDFNDPTVTQKLGNNLEMSGGLLSMYDGANVVEHGFNYYPPPSTLTPSGGGGLSAGTYQYSVTYEWTDAQGQLHRSAPSVAQSVPVALNDKVTLNIPTYRMTQKSNVLIVVYRTVVNQNQFYQVTPPPQTGVALANDTSVDSVTYVDTAADAGIIGNNQLYTNGGELENIEIPSTDILWTYQNRLMGVYAENPLQIGYSKQVIPGVPVEFTDSFVINVPEFDAGVTAGIQMDDKCIIFKYNTIYYMAGQGPSANGQNNDFTTPQIISTDCGCIDKKSVVLMPRGVMFKSTKGIYLLDRSLQVSYVGDEVEAYNSAVITSVQMIESVNQIRYSLDTGILIVYDYFYDQWATFTNINAVDSVIFQNVYTYLKSDGSVLQESIGSYTDNGSFVAIAFTTAWFSFAKLQGFERVYKMMILGDWKSAHTLQVQFAVNFNPAIVQTVSVPALTSLVPYQQRVFMDSNTSKCESFQVTITEQQTAPFGEGLTISALSFEAGMKKGTYKVTAANSYG